MASSGWKEMGQLRARQGPRVCSWAERMPLQLTSRQPQSWALITASCLFSTEASTPAASLSHKGIRRILRFHRTRLRSTVDWMKLVPKIPLLSSLTSDGLGEWNSIPRCNPRLCPPETLTMAYGSNWQRKSYYLSPPWGRCVVSSLYGWVERRHRYGDAFWSTLNQLKRLE